MGISYLFGVIVQVKVVSSPITNHIMAKLTYQNQDQRHKYHHLTMTLHLTLKMTTAQVAETSVTNNSLHLHLNDHAKQIIDEW